MAKNLLMFLPALVGKILEGFYVNRAKRNNNCLLTSVQFFVGWRGSCKTWVFGR